MGVVYDAIDERRGHRVALKTLKQPSAEAIYRLKREFRAMADISHPNLVQLYDLVVGDAVSYSMEVVEGIDFVSYCRGKDRKPVPPEDISGDTTIPNWAGDELPATGVDLDRLRATLPQLVGALRALHDARMVHRDVKPSNVLVTLEGRVVLLDFGLAVNRASLDKQSMAGLVGTIAYMSPEQADEQVDVGPSSDWYSVGVMIYEALTGRLPHDGGFIDLLLAKRSVPPRPLRDVVCGVPADLDELCMALLTPHEANRAGEAELTAFHETAHAPTPHARADATLSPQFIGRTRELAALDAAVEVVRGGRPAIAWVRGPSGIGKSTLVSEVLARIGARRRDAVVLRGRCYEQELVPFKAIDGLIDELSRLWRRMSDTEAASLLPRAPGSLARLFPVLARVGAVAQFPVIAESRDPLEVRARAFDALREVLQRLSDRRLVVMFLDDLQWVDGDTLHLLEALLRPPDPPRVLLLVSSRSEVPARGLEELIGRMDLHVARIELGPLGSNDARELVVSLLGDDGGEVADRVVREAEGSPFFLGEIVRYLQTAGRTASVEVGDVVRRRIGLLPETARQLLELVAISGEPVPMRELAAAARMDLEQVARDVRVLRVDHLIRVAGGRDDERVEPYHDRMRAAILDQLDADTRRERHRALALALGNQASPARLARHWAGAGDASRAATHARRAAESATATFDFESACELYRMALDLGDHDDGVRRTLRADLGHALRCAGRSADAAETFMAAAEGSDAAMKLELRRTAAELFLTAGMIERGVAVLREVLADVDEQLPRSNREALRKFIWYYLRQRMSSMRWTPRDASLIAPHELLRLDCYITLGLCLGMVDTVTGAMYQAKGLVVALRLGEPDRIFRIAALYAVFLGAQGGGSMARGRELLAWVEAIADKKTDPFRLAYLDLATGFHAFFAGEFELAWQRLGDAERRLQEETAGTLAELNSVRIIRCAGLRSQGRFVLLRERCNEHLRDAGNRGDQYLRSTLYRAFNQLWIAEDDVAGARDALAAATWSAAEQGFHLQHWYELRGEIEIALYTGEIAADALRASMAQFTASKLTRVQVVRAEAAWLRMRLGLAGVAGWNPKREARALEHEGPEFTKVWAMLGRAALASGPARTAILEATVALATRLSMHSCASAATWRLGKIEVARAELAAQGVVRPDAFVAMLAPGFGDG